MSKDHNRWIISSHRFVEHKSIDDAQSELERLRKKAPERQFRIYRIKSVIAPIETDEESQTGHDETKFNPPPD